MICLTNSEEPGKARRGCAKRRPLMKASGTRAGAQGGMEVVCEALRMVEDAQDGREVQDAG